MLKRTEPKPRACKVCRSQFTPSRMGQRVCGPACALSLAQSTRAKAEKRQAVKERKELRERKNRIKTRGDWAREAQQAVNAFVRERDKDLPCISCGRHHQGQYHAGHYRSVGSAPHLRFDVERNIARQCAPCNTHLSGNLVAYRIGLIARIGIEAVEALEADQAPRHYSIDDLKAIKALYQRKRREIS